MEKEAPDEMEVAKKALKERETPKKAAQGSGKVK